MKNVYKDTLLIGQTDFDMRAGLKDKEPAIQAMWESKKIYDQKQKLNEGKPLFMLHDGPPYANGDLHIGHALNKTLKDMIIRWKNANGYLAPFIMGWDTHGLPIETAVTKMGIDRKKTPAVDFRNMCKDYALKQVANQANQFKRLGIFSNSDVKYVTLTHDFEVSELRLFQKMYEKEMIYKALKPIYWSPSSESALAESEIEYKDIKSPTIFVAMNIVEGNSKIDTDTEIVIWTTTPWTIPSNQMAAVGENIEYNIVKVNERKFILASSLVSKIAEQIGWESFEILDTLKGHEIVGIKYSHPLYEQKINQVVIGHHVTDEAGTGIVHIAGGFGEDDYMIVKKHGLQPFAPIDDQGKFTSEIGEYDKSLVGVFYEEANKMVGMNLEAKKRLLKFKFVSHSYPHDWRTKKPVIYRCTWQWFIRLDKAKDQILSNVDNITTKPEWAKKRLYQVLEDRTDWTISRQRLWGVPIVAFYDEQDKLVLNNEILAFAINKISELGTNAWFDQPTDIFLPEEYKNKNLRKEKDILDVWFDSGSSAIALSERFKNLPLPYDLYLEGNDQYRGWFNASMINSTIYSGKSPYKKLISHGMTVDEKGNKMSKSLGNGIDPIVFANSQGADILRLWVASTDYTDDQKIGPEIIKQIGETYRKIRNTMRFILANLFDFDPTKDYQKELSEVDQFALHNLTIVKNKASEAYDNLAYNQVYNLLINYVTKDLSSFYLDFIKDILYIEQKDSLRRRQVQTVLYEQFWMLIDLLRPILIHTTEEAYQSMIEKNKAESVHLLDNRKQEFLQTESFITKWNNIMILRDDVNKALEIAREEKIINKGFEAIVNVCLKEGYKNIESVTELEKIFIVNTLNFTNNCSGLSDQKVACVGVEPKQGLKCERCWGIFDVLIDEEICERCHSVVKSI
ncbi:isoleucine--tRNA ligase [Mesoplasma chauliocola]|uniref:Isoleucine--tRNA ligase n=1 Tax=Mesoplasma chauliocola TaxID=216427 RepID=A0A249SNV1_9MOLU|nr:isoleucine--tRNA ligase [Mesoplasma chauliocola]ASZ09161.1 isoleucine--tRNA ligase [Mesoplasma chauliocola]